MLRLWQTAVQRQNVYKITYYKMDLSKYSFNLVSRIYRYKQKKAREWKEAETSFHSHTSRNARTFKACP